MQQQQQLQWSAACQWVLGWMGGGAGGEGGEGVCGRGSRGVRQLMVRAPAGHTGASRWRTSEPPHSSTKTLPTLAPCSRFQPKSLRSLSAFDALSLSLFLSVCLTVSLSLLPPSSLTLFPSSVSSFTWSKSRFICYLAAFSFLTYRCTFRGRSLWLCFLYLLLLRILCFYIFTTPFFCTVSLKSLHLKCSKEVFSGLNLKKKSKQEWFGLYVSQNTIKIVSIFERKEQFMGTPDICKGIRL